MAQFIGKFFAVFSSLIFPFSTYAGCIDQLRNLLKIPDTAVACPLDIKIVNLHSLGWDSTFTPQAQRIDMARRAPEMGDVYKILTCNEGTEVVFQGKKIIVPGQPFTKPEVRALVNSGILKTPGGDSQKEFIALIKSLTQGYKIITLTSYTGLTYHGTISNFEDRGDRSFIEIRLHKNEEKISLRLDRLDLEKTFFGAPFKEGSYFTGYTPSTDCSYVKISNSLGWEIGRIIGHNHRHFYFLPQGSNYSLKNLVIIPTSVPTKYKVERVSPNPLCLQNCPLPNGSSATTAEFFQITDSLRRNLPLSAEGEIAKLTADFLKINLEKDPIFGTYRMTPDNQVPTDMMYVSYLNMRRFQKLADHLKGTGVTLVHGSRSVSLLGFQHGNGLIPTGKMIQNYREGRGIPPFSGELYLGILGVNKENLSTFILSGFKDLSMYSGYKWTGEVKYSEGVTLQSLQQRLQRNKEYLGELGKETSLAQEATKERIKIIEMQIEAFKKMKPNEQEFLKNNFPVIYGISSSSGTIGKYSKGTMSSEVLLKDGCRWSDVKIIWAPKAEIDKIKGILPPSNIDIKVLPLEELILQES